MDRRGVLLAAALAMTAAGCGAGNPARRDRNADETEVRRVVTEAFAAIPSDPDGLFRRLVFADAPYTTPELRAAKVKARLEKLKAVPALEEIGRIRFHAETAIASCSVRVKRDGARRGSIKRAYLDISLSRTPDGWRVQWEPLEDDLADLQRKK